jgi:transcriptional regulator with XRE-family HTH domain
MEEELKKLKKYLPVGHTRILAAEFGITPMTVSNTLNGKRHPRFDIIKRAVEIARESMRIQKELEETVSEMEL